MLYFSVSYTEARRRLFRIGDCWVNTFLVHRVRHGPGKTTKRTLDAIQAGGVTGFLWDDELKGFGLKISAGGSASYIVHFRMGGREAKIRRYTIDGDGSPCTPFAAREEVTKRLRLGV